MARAGTTREKYRRNAERYESDLTDGEREVTGPPVPPPGGAGDLRVDVALPAAGEGLRAESGELRGVGAAGRVPVPGPAAGAGRRWLKTERISRTVTYDSNS